MHVEIQILHIKNLNHTVDPCFYCSYEWRLLTNASATASSTSDPVFRTRIALTDDDNLLDWLIPKPVPVVRNKEKTKKISTNGKNAKLKFSCFKHSSRK